MEGLKDVWVEIINALNVSFMFWFRKHCSKNTSIQKSLSFFIKNSMISSKIVWSQIKSSGTFCVNNNLQSFRSYIYWTLHLKIFSISHSFASSETIIKLYCLRSQPYVLNILKLLHSIRVISTVHVPTSSTLLGILNILLKVSPDSRLVASFVTEKFLPEASWCDARVLCNWTEQGSCTLILQQNQY